MLDVNGNLIVREIPDGQPNAENNYNFLVADSGTNEVQQIEANFAYASNTSISKAVRENGFSLLITSALTGWETIDFDAGNLVIDTAPTSANFDVAADSYKVPSDGIYEITYFVKYGDGVIATVLANKKIGILRTSGTVVDVLDEKKFDGANIDIPLLNFLNLPLGNGLLGITISNTTINSVFALEKDDLISFAISSGLDVNLLASSRAEFVIKKISN